MMMSVELKGNFVDFITNEEIQALEVDLTNREVFLKVVGDFMQYNNYINIGGKISISPEAVYNLIVSEKDNDGIMLKIDTENNDAILYSSINGKYYAVGRIDGFWE